MVLGAGIELGLRVWAGATHHERALRFDPVLGWRLRAGARVRGRYWSGPDRPARINSHGLRDAEHTPAKPPGTYRIVALGDSFTYGAAVDYGQRFTEVLEERLAKVEVVNFGCSAYGPDQELLILEREGLDWDPDLVLCLIYFGNDLRDIRHEKRFGWPRPWFELAGSELTLHPPQRSWDLWVREHSLLGNWILDRVPVPPRHVLAPAWRDPSADPFWLLVRLVERMRADSQAHGARFLAVLAHAPSRYRAAPGPDARRALRAFERLGIPTFDTHAAIAAAVASGQDVFATDGHWNARGHELVGRALADFLVERGWAEASGR